MAEAASDAHHLHHIFHPLLAQRIGMDNFIGQCEHIVETIEVAGRGVQIARLHRITTGKMDAVEILRQLQKITKALAIPHPAATIKIRAIGRAGDIAEHQVFAANGNGVIRIAWGDGERRRCGF